MLKKLVVTILSWEARLVIRRFHPKVVGITGSVGKTSTKEAVYAVLKEHFKVRKSPKSYNSELGLPLTILNLNSERHSVWGWFKNIAKGFFVLFSKEYPEVLVLEMGVDRPGDMDHSLTIVQPDVSVVTAIGEVPVHVEFFSGPLEVAREKGKIVKHMSAGGRAVLNFDDEVVYEMKDQANGQVLTFGYGEGAQIRISQYRLLTSRFTPAGDSSGQGVFEIPQGVAFKVDYAGNTVPVRLEGSFGKQQAYAAGAAITVGLAFEQNLISIVEALQDYQAPPGRLKLIPGVKNTLLLDDTYNASPIAMHAALDALQDMPAVRKIAVLGDMLEIGKFTIQAHQTMGEIAANIVDVLITVGPRAKFIAEEARARGIRPGNVMEFNSSGEAGQKLQEILKPGDVVLVKGSQSMRMEKVVEEVMAHPEDAKELLVRQEEFWKQK